jgi:predicted transcriptional regulator
MDKSIHLTIPKLAQRCDLSDNTVRRYIKNYPQFFKSEIIDGWEQFETEYTLKLIARINEVCAAGKRRAEVVKELEKEFEVIVAEPAKPDNGAVNGEGGELVPVLTRIAENLEKIVKHLLEEKEPA